MCQEIMAPQVEHIEENTGALVLTEADETQQQPEKFRCVRVYLYVCTDAGIDLKVCLYMYMHEVNAFCMCLNVHLRNCQRSHFFVFLGRHLGLGDSISHLGGMSWKTKLRGFNISTKYVVYLGKLIKKEAINV